MIVKCVIACHNAQGEPDLVFIKVRCMPAQYDEGKHYLAAERWAGQGNYEGPFVVFDEHDGPSALFDLFVWDSACVCRVG
jgi:hypothetical protein